MNPTALITSRLRLQPVPSLPELILYAAHSGSRLSQLADPDDSDPAPPYWAYSWGGGLALAHHLAAHPEAVAGRRVLDLGAGSGLVAIAAAKAGAAQVIASEIDPFGRAAIPLNAAANTVAITLRDTDLAAPPPTDIDVLLAGDVFYSAEVASLMLPYLTRCQAAGITVLIGDPYRKFLPATLVELARYAVPDMGAAPSAPLSRAGVFGLSPA